MYLNFRRQAVFRAVFAVFALVIFPPALNPNDLLPLATSGGPAITGKLCLAVALFDEFKCLGSGNELEKKQSVGPLPSAPQLKEPTGQSDSYLNLVIELRRNGSFKIIKATQIAGQVIVPDFPTSNFVYEATSDHMTLAIGFFADDPFTVRGFADSHNSPESIAKSQSATVVINIPLIDASPAALNKIHLRIIKLMSEPSTGSLNSALLARLKAQRKAILLNDLPASKLGPAIKKILVKLKE